MYIMGSNPYVIESGSFLSKLQTNLENILLKKKDNEVFRLTKPSSPIFTHFTMLPLLSQRRSLLFRPLIISSRSIVVYSRSIGVSSRFVFLVWSSRSFFPLCTLLHPLCGLVCWGDKVRSCGWLRWRLR